MRSPSLSELPAAPAGKTGWPWTEGQPELDDRTPEGRPWPRVSIVTPSYNQGSFLEETIRSVLLQGYPNLEYSIIDGGSTDGSMEVVRRYEPWLTYWVSEADAGQSAAINRGFSRATGDIFGWLNSDDVYEPGALAHAATYLSRTPRCGLVYGNGCYIDVRGARMKRCRWVRTFDRRRLLTFNFILQPAAFWRYSVWQATGGLEVAYHWAMDWDWFIRATTYSRADHLPIDLARFRLRPEIKSLSGGRARAAEIAAISRHYGGNLQPTYLQFQLLRFGWSLSERAGTRPVGRLVEASFSLAAWLLRASVWRERSLL
jgi:glycosyltransferase involved in cell wall biosynthesis